MNRIVVLGYYYRNNLGDDSFMDAFRKIFEKAIPDIEYEINFYNTDDIKQLPLDTKILVCGAGDIINLYFLNKIISIIEATPDFNGPIYAFGVGAPGQEIVNWGYMDFFDHAILRSSSDYKIVSSRLGTENVDVFPDITCILPYRKKAMTPMTAMTAMTGMKAMTAMTGMTNTQKKVGVFLARPICANMEDYSEMVSQISISLDKISELGYTIELIPFNTDSKNADEDDRILNEDVYKNMIHKKNVDKITHILTFEEMQDKISELDFAICMRFHSHVFAAMNNVPFISLCFSPKVTKFCQENKIDDFIYLLKKDEKAGYPTEIDSEKIITMFKSMVQVTQQLSLKLSHTSENLSNLSQDTCKKIRSLLVKRKADTIYLSPKRRNTMPYFVYPKANQLNRLKTCRIICKQLAKNTNNKDLPLEIERLAESLSNGTITIYHLYNLMNVMTEIDKDQVSIKETSHILARIVCYFITGQSFPIYYDGLAEQILTPKYNFLESWEWILKEWNQVNRTKKDLEFINFDSFPVKFDLHTLEQRDFGDVHRSGWQYVVDHMFGLDSKKGGVIMDTYLDKTFGWCSEFYEKCEIIPYRKPWIGFIHHTFDQLYSSNNAYSLLHSPLFQESLKHCRGIYALSEDLAMKIRIELNFQIPVNVLKHPTEIPTEDHQFSLKKFMNNPDKKIVQIGAWLRESYSIYKIPIDKVYKNPLSISKAVLKGKSMGNYFRPKKSYIVLTSNQDSSISSTKMALCPCKCVCKPKSINYITGITPKPNIENQELCPSDKESLPNKYMHGLVKSIEENHQSVQLIQHLSNSDFDKLLTENLVFLNLIDASACNTLIESIVRRTPILINKHPAVIEYLGEDYPFYYESFREAADKATDQDYIRKTFEYLSKKDISDLFLQGFFVQFQQSSIYQSLCKEFL